MILYDRRSDFLVAASHINHDVIDESGQRTDGGYHVSVGGRLEGIACLCLVARVGDACMVEPCEGSAAGINLYG